MADNVIANPGAGGATLRTLDDGSVEWPVSALAYATTVAPGANVLQVVTNSAGLPVAQQGTWNVAVSNFPATQAVSGTVAVSGSVAVTGTFWQATQPVSIASAVSTKPDGTIWTLTGTSANVNITNASVAITAASLPLPSNAAIETGGNLATLVTRTTLGQTTMSASRPVVIASDQSTLPVNQAGVSATGSLAALNATVALTLNGASGWAVDLRGTFVATVTFQGTVDGTNWFTIAVLPAGGTVNVASVTTATAVGTWWGNATGCQQVRAIATAYTSGSVTVVLRAMQAAGVVTALPSGQATVAVSMATNTPTLAAGTNLAADVGVQYRASATGGATPASILSPATPAATSIKATAGRLVGLVLVNSAATVRSVKFWNTAVAGITLGTTAALFEIDIPPSGLLQIAFDGGIGFGTAITYAVTGAKGLTDNTAITANDVSGFAAFA